MKKILIIEDTDFIRENLVEILELADYEVMDAPNGKIGVEIAKDKLPDLILCDVMMPELDGYGVLHMLSRNPNTSTIPFIFLTAKTEKSDVRKGMLLGADDYITKPFEEAEILDAIEIRLKKSEEVKKKFESNEQGIPKLIYEDYNNEQLLDLTIDRKTRAYKKKEFIYREGDTAHYLYFILDGKVKSTKTDDYGKELVTDIFNKGDFFGYMPILENTEYKESAIALENIEIAIIPKNDFVSLISMNRPVANNFIKLLANNVQEKEERLLRLAYSPVRERVANTIVKLSESEEDLTISISRDDLASIVGTSTESLIRTLSEFKSSNLIEISGRKIKVIDSQKLKAIST